MSFTRSYKSITARILYDIFLCFIQFFMESAQRSVCYPTLTFIASFSCDESRTRARLRSIQQKPNKNSNKLYTELCHTINNIDTIIIFDTCELKHTQAYSYTVTTHWLKCQLDKVRDFCDVRLSVYVTLMPVFFLFTITSLANSKFQHFDSIEISHKEVKICTLQSI